MNSVMLEARPELFEIERVDVVKIKHTVRIAHRNTGDFVHLAVNGQWPILNLTVGVHRNFSPVEDRLAHVDFHQFTDDPRPDDTGAGFHFKRSLGRDAVIVDVFGEAADAVAAHLHLAAVGVINLHLEIGDFRRMHRQQLIGADAEAAIAKFFRDKIEIFNVLFQAIDKHEIVARAVHLGELEFHNRESLTGRTPCAPTL